MKRSILITFLFASLLSEAQSFAEDHYQYDRVFKTMLGYYNRGLYYKATEYPDSLKGNRNVNKTTNYFIARVYALANEYDKTLEYLETAVKKGITKYEIDRIYDLDGFRESNMGIMYEVNYDKWHQEYLENKITFELDSNFIQQIKKIDSKYRERINYRVVDGDMVIEVKDSLKHFLAKKQMDSTSFYRMVELTIEKGFPTYSIVGKEFFKHTRFLRYKMPEDYDKDCTNWEKIKKLIYAEIEKGTIYPYYYALIEDNSRLKRKQALMYGTIRTNYYNRASMKNTVLFENPEELNVRRRKVGLCSIQLELWSKAQELPDSLKGVVFK